MIDIHSHLLYGVDDGAKTIEDSLSILSDLKDLGYTDVILTPHYIKDSHYDSTRSENLKRLKVLREELQNNNININVYLGNEIYIDDDIEDFLNNNVISSLNDSNFLLIELPMSGEYPNYKEIFNYLIKKNYNVILAHPERYMAFQKDFSKIEELSEIGVYFQCNIESIVGRYGKTAKKTIKKILKNHKINFLATDIHHKRNKEDFLKAKKLILKYITKEEFNILTYENPSKIIN